MSYPAIAVAAALPIPASPAAVPCLVPGSYPFSVSLPAGLILICFELCKEQKPTRPAVHHRHH